MTFTESLVEDATLGWLGGIGWSIAHGLEIAPGEPVAEGAGFAPVVFEGRLRAAADDS